MYISCSMSLELWVDRSRQVSTPEPCGGSGPLTTISTKNIWNELKINHAELYNCTASSRVFFLNFSLLSNSFQVRALEDYIFSI